MPPQAVSFSIFTLNPRSVLISQAFLAIAAAKWKSLTSKGTCRGLNVKITLNFMLTFRCGFDDHTFTVV